MTDPIQQKLSCLPCEAAYPSRAIYLLKHLQILGSLSSVFCAAAVVAMALLLHPHYGEWVLVAVLPFALIAFAHAAKTVHRYLVPARHYQAGRARLDACARNPRALAALRRACDHGACITQADLDYIDEVLSKH